MALYTPAPSQIQGTSTLYDQPTSVNIENINPNTSRSITFPSGVPAVSLIKTWQYVMQNYQADTWITWYESPNSVAKINFKYVFNTHWEYAFDFRYNDSILLTANFIDTNDVISSHLSDGYVGIVFMQDQDIISIVTSDKYFGAFAYLSNNKRFANVSVETYLSDSAPILYHWEPVSHLAGNDNQFYLALSQIDASIIGDGNTPASSTDESKFVLPDGADISRLLANVPNDTETTIAYSGHHYMTVTRRYVVTETDHNLIYYTFKFYYDDNPPVYTSEEFVINDPPTSRQYLSFIIDNENEVAALDIIYKYPLTGTFTYNNTALPDAQDLNDIWYWLSTNGGHTEDDPYATGSTDDGGTSGNPRPQDHINDSLAPTLSGLNLGIVTLYQPTDTELSAISSFLWSDDVLDNFKKYFNNFADNIMALYILPFTPSGLPTKIFKVGKLASDSPSLQTVKFCTQRYYDIDMGSVVILQRWGSYLDYAPYTKIEVYLPYCGIHSLDIDELMSPAQQSGTLPTEQGCTLSLKYRLDILTGVIVAKLLVNGDVRYQFNGKVGSNTPLTGQTYTNWIGSIITAGAGAAMTIASGGMTAPMVAGAAASVAGTVLAQKPNVESIGNISGDASMLATNVPYVRIASPNKPLLENQEVFTGYPSYKSGTVGSFSGYTEFVEAHVEGISCTEEERAEIISLLKAGVII